MKNRLIGSTGSSSDLKKAIAEYWYCEEEEIELNNNGLVKKKGVAMSGLVWRKLKGRYRFEALL